jgi:hypothetical protein
MQETHERQQIHATKATQHMEMHMVEMKAELKQRAFELSHIKVVVGASFFAFQLLYSV